MWSQGWCLIALLALLFSQLLAAPANAEPGSLQVGRAMGTITVDGALDDPGWAGTARVDHWYETNPGDNVEPKVGNVGRLAYDDRFLYIGLEFEDPEPERILAPLGDRDNVPSSTDYGGVILDARNDGKTAQMFLANPRGIQYDALSSDISGEDSSPDFFWESAARITPTGWVLEIGIPFSSLRYDGDGSAQTWRILLYRNRPRDFRYQMFSAPIPRGRDCFICNAKPLEGLENLPGGGHVVLAPFVFAAQRRTPVGEAGTPLGDGEGETELGFDLKWTPNPDTAIDVTVNPDFSQVESDAAQISTNERFALFFAEKRPFFLEAIDLLQTPIRAAYTRTITAPRWGGRFTGSTGKTAYTALVADDRGGGSVVLPGPDGSSLADQDFSSLVGIARVRHDLGRSFTSFLVSGRESDGGGSNLVLGPDFQWRPTNADTITGQFLWSKSQTLDRPDLADEWDGRSLSGHAADLWWRHSTATIDWFAEVEDYGEGFRADSGFVPQVGIRRGYGEVGYTRRSEGRVPRLRSYLIANRTEDRDGGLVSSEVSPGFGLDSLWSSFVRIRLSVEEVRAGERILPRNRLISVITFSPSRILSRVEVESEIGDQVDFANERPGDGGRLSLNATVRPTDHLELLVTGERRWVDVDPEDRPGGRLFTAEVARLRATYAFNQRSWLRLIAQQVRVRRDPGLYLEEVEAETGDRALSAQFAYRLNWQTVLYAGWGDERVLIDRDRYEPNGDQFFLKISYALQR